MLWNEDLVVLVEWVSLSEEFLVEPNACLCDSEHLLEVAISNNRLSCIDSHVWEALVISLMIFIGSCNNGIEVGRDLERFGEGENLQVANSTKIMPEYFSSSSDDLQCLLSS